MQASLLAASLISLGRALISRGLIQRSNESCDVCVTGSLRNRQLLLQTGNLTIDHLHIANLGTARIAEIRQNVVLAVDGDAGCCSHNIFTMRKIHGTQ